MTDQIAQTLADLKKELLDQLNAPDGHQAAVVAIRQLAQRHPRCIEIALAIAVFDFFSHGLEAGLVSAKKVLEERDKYYSIACLDALKVTRLRGLVVKQANLAPADYINFLFPLYYLRDEFENGGFLYSWIESEWKKRDASGQYNELYLLRNMTWSLTRGLVSSERRIAIDKQIQLMDAALIKLLRHKIAMRPRKKSAAIRKVAICCGLLKHSSRGVHARLVFDYARNLVKAYPGLTVCILVTNELPFSWVGHSFSMERTTAAFNAQLNEEARRLIADELGERVLYKNLPLAHGSWQDLWHPIQALLDFDPDVLMFYGAKFHNESWFARKVLFEFYPTAYFFSQMNNRVDPDNDIYLARNNHPLVGAHDESRIRVAPPAVRGELILNSKETEQFEYPSSEVKRSACEITLVTVLSGPRMETIFERYRPSTRARMMALLDIPGVRWIWVGPSNPKALLKVDPLFQAKHAEGQLEIRKFESHLEALYRKCDLMLHLPRFTGGGGGVILALRNRLPILCFGNTDSSMYVLPECVFGPKDVAGYFARAGELVKAPELLQDMGDRAAAHYASFDVGGLAKLTYKGLQEAVTFFNARTDGGAAHGQ